MERYYANVIVDISHEKVDRPFQYRIPEALKETLQVGMCVHIPFGRGDTLRKGYVVEITDRPEFDPEKQKEIADIAKKDTTVEAGLIELAAWMKENYGSTMIQALKTVLPAKQKTNTLQQRTIRRLINREEVQQCCEIYEKKHQTAKLRLMREFIEKEALSYELVVGKLHISASTLKALEGEGVIRIESRDKYRNPVTIRQQSDNRKELSPKQQDIVTTVLADFDKGIKKTYLIHGITGSGKTEVYMNLIEGMIQRGKQAIVLIPEIALTYQTLVRFYSRFGDRVSVMNSTLSAGEKYDQFERAKKGELDVMIGPRSALFTPFPKLGLIIMDEEHESSYKSENMPRYHARETAIQIASMQGADVVLGSATPSLESYYRAQKGEYQLFTLKERLTGGVLPTVYIDDLRKELHEGNRSIFSRRLQGLIEDRLQKKQQIMLFLNRRGYAGFISCRSCGYVVKCPHCDVSLSEHRGGRLVCHYCGYETGIVRLCPECGSKYILGFRAGTQQIEEQIHKMYPSARVLRMDADTTRKKESYEQILSAFDNGEADILVGTQMIVKGHDFPNVTLVGILAADMSLFAGDYRAGERTFQLLTQAAGRAGRGNIPGEVVIQTYQPEHYSIVRAAEQDYENFYEEEMFYRECGGYPPASNLLAVLIQDKDEERSKKIGTKMAELVKTTFSHHNMIVVGPSDAAIGKVNDRYRTVFYVKHPDDVTLIQARDLLEKWEEEQELSGETMIQYDMNPMNLY